jgi:hypothetical protein
MGLDTHMILETVPVHHSPRRTAHHAINRSSRHYAGTVTVGHGSTFEILLPTSTARATSKRAPDRQPTPKTAEG